MTLDEACKQYALFPLAVSYLWISKEEYKYAKKFYEKTHMLFKVKVKNVSQPGFQTLHLIGSIVTSIPEGVPCNALDNGYCSLYKTGQPIYCAATPLKPNLMENEQAKYFRQNANTCPEEAFSGEYLVQHNRIVRPFYKNAYTAYIKYSGATVRLFETYFAEVIAKNDALLNPYRECARLHSVSSGIHLPFFDFIVFLQAHDLISNTTIPADLFTAQKAIIADALTTIIPKTANQESADLHQQRYQAWLQAIPQFIK